MEDVVAENQTGGVAADEWRANYERLGQPFGALLDGVLQAQPELVAVAQQPPELFLVIRGVLKMNLRDKVVMVNENEFLVVPKGVEHKPESPDEAWILLFEPAATLNTGNIVNEFTRHNVEKI